MVKKKKTTAKRRGVRKPQKWDKAVSVAYLRLLGQSQRIAAKHEIVSERTIACWEVSSWWPEALAEARNRWLSKCDAAAMRGIAKAFGDPVEYAKHSRWYADRRIPELAPPTTRTELTGADGGPLEIQDHREQVNSLVARISAAIKAAKDT